MERRLGEPNADMGAGHASPSRAFIPGLVVVAVVVVVARFVDRSTDVSSLVVAVVLGAIAANAGLIRPVLRPGLAFAGRRLLRIGVVLLGLRLSFDDIRGLGIVGAVSVIVVINNVKVKLGVGDYIRAQCTGLDAPALHLGGAVVVIGIGEQIGYIRQSAVSGFFINENV